jgi:hypothetical protein
MANRWPPGVAPPPTLAKQRRGSGAEPEKRAWGLARGGKKDKMAAKFKI